MTGRHEPLFMSGKMSFPEVNWLVEVTLSSRGVAAINILEWPVGQTGGMLSSGAGFTCCWSGEVTSELSGQRSFVASRLKAYLTGVSPHCLVPIDLSGASRFQQSVYRVTRSIPPGIVATYGWVAAQLGQSACSRAVGQALGKNPVPLAVPCHRVVASDGLGGFSGGLDLKKTLLRLEGWKEGFAW